MKTVWLLAWIVIQQMLKKKFFVGLIVSILFLVCISIVFSTLVLTESSKILADSLLMMNEVLILLIALFFWSQWIHQEITHKTVELYRMQGISIVQMMFWWYIGFVALMMGVMIFSLCSYLGFIGFWALVLNMSVVISFAVSFLVGAILLPWVLFFSTIVNSFLALVIGGVIYFLWQSMAFVLWYVTIFQADMQHWRYTLLIQILYVIIPNFQILNMKDQLLSPFVPTIAWSWVVFVIIYVLYSIFLLILSAKMLSKKLR